MAKSFYSTMKKIGREVDRQSRANAREVERRRKEEIKRQKEYEKQQLAYEKERAIEYAKSTTEEVQSEREALNNVIDTIQFDSEASNFQDLKEVTPFLNEKPVPPITKKNPEKPVLKYNFVDKLSNNRQLKKKEAYDNALIKWDSELKKVEEYNASLYKKYEADLTVYLKGEEEFLKKQDEHNKYIQELEDGLIMGKQESIELYYNRVFESLIYDFDLETLSNIEYRETGKILLVDYYLPTREIIPRLKLMKYVQSRKEFTESQISEKQTNDVYNNLLYSLILEVTNVIYKADENAHIDSVVINGWLEDINQATGNLENFCLMSLQTNKEDFQELNLSRVEPKECFRKLKGVAKSNLNDLVPVVPILTLNREDERFVESKSIGEKINGTNLATMNWEEFEHLVRELFERVFTEKGIEIKTTRSSKDGGVDAVMFDSDPITGGKFIVQAKRYTNLVGVSAVRDLYGTIMNEGATKGILVTTSDYGPDSYEFARNKPISLLNGNNLLSMLSEHGYENIRIDLKEK
ncbi:MULTISPECIES: restriction endonuclease [unclassified Listeria]|uniref:restriction endonuclease n=1 Tax=unclassified Listeria TaxID=2642072 RepID=UPI000B58E1CE|nr:MULTISPECIES: restriction endonuclease [unclassified Listeria]